ncbi:Tat pathway signal sequence domain protein [Cohnella zeiphila]|uniref:Tat pathway signal sequence domain protein n=1 Tax=Cohnella zeiphila TaxID=2761120 RepID=A0A7X0SKB2_9BACL|nr:Tat pathway signal sequence domain protein [Cohnella zeiphila]MBB6731554.1 Tat pathway signal sequence domain protein [Cohnella zeiphila]
MRAWSQRKFVMSACAVLLALTLLPSQSFGSPLGAKVKAAQAFDLTAPAKELISGTDLQNNTVLQSFAFDNVNHYLYTVQLMAGGQQLPGESAPVSGADRALNGDLCLTKLDESGHVISYMYLKGFGHGVQIGVEPGVGQNGEPVSYLWTEVDAAHDHPADGTNGWGTQIARFPFTDGAVVTPNTPWLEKYSLIQGADRTTVSLDTAHDLLTMRYRLDGLFHFAVFELSKVKSHSHVQPLADVVQPQLSYDFQGFTSYGSTLYLLEGTHSVSTYPDGNTYITSVDLNSGEVTDRQLMTAAPDLTYREPEGLAVQLPDPNHPEAPRLAFGFASGDTGGRQANIYYLDALKD